MGLCCCKIEDDEENIPNNRNARGQIVSNSRFSPITRTSQITRTQSRISTISDTVSESIISDNSRSHFIPQRPSRSQGKKTKINFSHITEEVIRQTETIIFKDDDMVINCLKILKVHHAPVLPNNEVYSLEELDYKSNQFVRTVLFKNKRFNELYDITKAFRIWNPYLMIQYTLNKEKYGNTFKERHLYHGTAQTSVPGILTHNFNWRFVKEYWFGKGVYFANNPYYASHYGKKRQSGSNDYVMIVAKVLMENGIIDRGFANTVVPAAGHTTRSENGQEFIKYDDACFYPEFLVYYNHKIKSHL